MPKNILVTGGAGFIGSHFIAHWLSKNSNDMILNLDNLSYAGRRENMASFYHHPKHQFIQGDITDIQLVSQLFEAYHLDGVIHFAAESHVDNSIERPLSFVETNVLGTSCLLEAARKTWLKAPFSPYSRYENARFCHISTDEVYGSLGVSGAFNECSAYAPNSPYSASKAASDMMVRAYHHTYGLNTVMTHCSNNFGAHQHEEKLIPTIIRRALALEVIPIYGDGLYTRDWLYVEDHCKAIDLCFNKGRSGEVYDIGARNEWNNLALAELICGLLDQKQPSEEGSYRRLIRQVADRPGHDRRYAIDPSKIEKELGWSANPHFLEQLGRVVDSYMVIANQCAI